MRVTDAMAKDLEVRGCDVTTALIEFTDERWVAHLSRFPMKRPMAEIATILPAQMRHKTGAIRIPAEAQTGEYELVLIFSPPLVVPDVHADPFVSRVARRERNPRRHAVRNGVDL